MLITASEIDARRLELMVNSERWWRGLMRQHMLNNLWDNNPGELERWADDGGRVPDDA